MCKNCRDPIIMPMVYITIWLPYLSMPTRNANEIGKKKLSKKDGKCHAFPAFCMILLLCLI